MTASKPASMSYAEQFVPESPLVEQAREAGERLGAVPVGTGAGAVLRMLAAATRARAVIEVGTGAGVSGLWLLEGMPDDGVLTTIDLEPEHQRAARAAFAAAGVSHTRTRLIAGRALDVLPRMTNGAYDMVVVDADKLEYPDYVRAATDLLRPGGLLVLDNMLWHDKVADPATRDETTRTLRDLGRELRDSDDFHTSLLPVSDGLLVAVRR